LDRRLRRGGADVGRHRRRVDRTRLLAGEFVKYRSRFPAEFGCSADLPAGAFAEAVRRVSLVAERGTPVQLSFAPGRVTIVAATQGQARARESVPADFSGDEPVIAFNPHYLLDGVVAAAGSDAELPDGARVRLRFTSASKPAVITQVTTGEPAAFRYLVVPQRLAFLPARPALPARRPGTGTRMGVVPVPGEQERREQPDHHRQDQQRQGGEPPGPVRRGVVPAVAGPRSRRECRARPGLPSHPGRAGKVGHDLPELAVRPGREHLAEAVVEFVEGEPAGYVVVAQVRRRRFAVGVPDAQHVPRQGPVRFPVPVREGDVVTHRHGASGAR